MNQTPQHSEPIEEAPRPSLRKLGGATLGLLQNHLELFGLEFQEEKSRVLRLGLFAGIALVCGLMFAFGLFAVVLILFVGGGTTPLTVGLAWAYTAIRIVHSLWQALVNRLPVRFTLFILSTLCLLGLTLAAVALTLG